MILSYFCKWRSSRPNSTNPQLHSYYTLLLKNLNLKPVSLWMKSALAALWPHDVTKDRGGRGLLPPDIRHWDIRLRFVVRLTQEIGLSYSFLTAVKTPWKFEVWIRQVNQYKLKKSKHSLQITKMLSTNVMFNLKLWFVPFIIHCWKNITILLKRNYNNISRKRSRSI